MTTTWSILTNDTAPKLIQAMSPVETLTAGADQAVLSFTGNMPAEVVPGSYEVKGDAPNYTFSVYESQARKEARYTIAKLLWEARQKEWRDELAYQEEAIRIAGNKKLDAAWAATYLVDQDVELTLDMKILIHEQALLGATDVDTVEKFIPVADQFQDDPTGAFLWVGRDGVRTNLAGAVNWGTYPGRKFYQKY